MKKYDAKFAVLFLSACVLIPGKLRAADPETEQRPDYLSVVRSYADTLLEHGRDTYGKVKSPLIAAALDRKTLRLGKFGSISATGWRNTDRTLTGANPMHDQDLYQILYALTEITGEKKYAAEADKVLKFFFENCQSPVTGLMMWGEHGTWDFYRETIVPADETWSPDRPTMCGNYDIHEFGRPWVLWDRCYQLAPEACIKFAKGLWNHQIHDQKTGAFSRHAKWSRHYTDAGAEFPRHGGFYIMTWAKAYRETKDPVYAQAVETLVDMYNRFSSKKTGAIPWGEPLPAKEGRRPKSMWPDSNMSLAIDLTDSAPCFSEDLRKKMLKQATDTDKVFLAVKHFSPGVGGFVRTANVDTLELVTDERPMPTPLWGYRSHAFFANLCYLRYRQLPEGETKEAYKKLILYAANLYLDSQPMKEMMICPGLMGEVIFHMLAAYDLTGEKKYLVRADFFADFAVKSLITDKSPLPKASTRHDHYEAITGADLMMMALLKLWQTNNRPDLKLNLVNDNR